MAFDRSAQPPGAVDDAINTAFAAGGVSGRVASWAEALGRAAAALRTAQEGYERDAAGFLGRRADPSEGVDNTLSVINAMLTLRKIGKLSCCWGCLTRQGNGHGGRERGQKADWLSGCRLLASAGARERIAKVLGVSPHELPAPSKSAYEMRDALGTDGGVRVLWVFISHLAIFATLAQIGGDAPKKPLISDH